ncbi:MAG TPA: serine protein kinase PrkA [Polyangia bacterium]|jgi:predicted Ser/Thr protein kinase|nr:serine protein kinase PrkA [Polyangia bacterium]
MGTSDTSRSPSGGDGPAPEREGDNFDAKAWLVQTTGEMRESFARNRRVISYGEYFALFGGEARRQVRSAAQYLRDVFEYFGTEQVRTPRGPMTRWHLFDCPWDAGKDALMGQEEVQAAVYRLISNFAREGRTNRLILLHGPNGSAKSTFVACMQRAMEHYSTLPEGALYRFNWIFPSQKLTRGGIGFGGGGNFEAGGSADTFAYLEDDLIEAKIVDEMRDHPLLLLPLGKRRELIEQRLEIEIRDGYRPADYLLRGDLSHRNRQIFEALLSSYHGDLSKVLRHVQVERFFVSRRYRQGAATVEPQLAVDARSRQLTMDRSLASLPPALQSLTLYEYQGELVDGNRGIVDFADLLKRPLEAYKYLLGTVEQGRISLDVASLELDTVFIGSSNEGYLAAFKEVPEFQSFKGRMELVRVPYLLDYHVEERIYQAQIKVAHSQSGKHVAPHVAWVSALWAVLTRMKKPLAEKYSKSMADVVARLGPMEKALLYAEGAMPDGISADQQRELVAGIDKIARESDNYPNYEGRTGASPREMKLLLMNAAQSIKYHCLSPFALFDELEDLVRGVTVYEFLKQEPLPGGFHENRKFIFQVRDRLIDRIDDEVRTSMGLVDERRYIEQFERYASQASYWHKREKIHNPITGRDEDPDEDYMADVERMLDVGNRKEEFRREVIARIGAWSIDHPRQKPDYEKIFPRPIAELREAFFNDRKKQVRKINEDLLVLMTDGPTKMHADAAAAAQLTLDTMKSRFGYCEHCAKDAVLALIRKRYS